jgi:hypothetical protein
VVNQPSYLSKQPSSWSSTPSKCQQDQQSIFLAIIVRVISTLTLWDLQDTCAHHIVSWTANCLALSYSFPNPRDSFTSYIKSKDIWLCFNHHSSDSDSTALSSTQQSQLPYTQASQLQLEHFLGAEPEIVYHGSQPILPIRYTEPHPSALVQPNPLTNFSDHGCGLPNVY